MPQIQNLQTPQKKPASQFIAKTAVRQASKKCAMFLIGLLAVSIAVAKVDVNNESLLIRNAKIISGDNPQVSVKQDLLIRNGRILAIGKNLGHANKQIDARGQYLIPGLIDTHVHLDGVPGYAGDNPKDEAMLSETKQQIPRSYLYFGFTTVLDLAGDDGSIVKWNAQALAPKAYFCAPVIIPNGYPASWLDKDAQFTSPSAQYMLFDSQQPNVHPASFLREAHTPQAVVELAKKNGANCIKVFYETGFGPKKNLPVPSVALIQAVVEQAKKLGLPVYLHGNSQEAYEFALKAGVSTLVHGMWHETKNTAKLDNLRRTEQMALEIVKAGISIQPTIQVLYGEQEVFNPAFFKDPKVLHAIPLKMRQWYQSDAGQWMKNILAEEFPPTLTNPLDLYAAVKTAYDKPLSTVRRMTSQLSKDGAHLLFGSDTPSGPFYSQFPGVNGRWEMDRWLETGLSLTNLFTAMTIDNARALGVEKSLGSVQVGMQANLLLLKDNPLSTVSAYDTIQQVILNGKAHERKIFSAEKISTERAASD